MRWSRVAYAAGGVNYNAVAYLAYVSSYIAVSAGALEIANVIQGALEVFWLYT